MRKTSTNTYKILAMYSVLIEVYSMSGEPMLLLALSLSFLRSFLLSEHLEKTNNLLNVVLIF